MSEKLNENQKKALELVMNRANGEKLSDSDTKKADELIQKWKDLLNPGDVKK